ncbi:MAG TPA: M3 family oligoendopeptidase [Armatimonadota bacterium]
MLEPTKVVWNLKDLFGAIDDPRIEQSLEEQLQRSIAFEERYRGRINVPDLSASTLQESLQEFESIQQEGAKPGTYSGLLFSADTNDPERGALMQRIQERSTEISLHLLFYELDLMAIPEEVLQPLMAAEELANYRHFLTSLRAFREHILTEPEEKILEEKANSGRRALDRLFDEVTSNTAYNVEGQEGELNQSEVLAMLRNPDREVRRLAASGFSEGLKTQARVVTFIFNTLLLDKQVDDRLRRYAYPEESRHLANELDRETVEVMAQTCVDNYPLVARYYHVKRQILGYDELTHYDRYAPLFDATEEVSFEEGKSIVLEAFGAFNPTMEEAAREFFDKEWIDAEVRKGKRGGAFCSYATPDLHPYVLVNYLNRMDDVMTLAHELGHGVHSSVSRIQSYLNFHGTLPVAELASTFGEMLVFEKLQARATLQDRLALYAEKIEGVFATIFRQAAMYRFEQAIHARRREQGELTTEEYSDIWQGSIQAMFGDSVKLGDEHKLWWAYVSHFVGSPFYVYAYSFGELLVLALFSMYKREGQPFADRYLELLRTGGSLSPQEMMSRVGINLRDPNFWKGGMEVLEGMIARFEEIHGEWQASGAKA